MARITAKMPFFGHTGLLPLSEQACAASISPSARDLVLASSSGLRIVDLDDPSFSSRTIFYPVGNGFFDVQWSPHAFRDSWIVSTAGSSAVLWDVASSRTDDPILEELRGHSRSISDLNFSAHHPEIVATCSIDSFVFLWDVRTPRQPVVKLADWHESASQVKFNRQDEHILASAHGGHFDVWDDRKASVPLKSIEAHSTKIYGIDWHREYKENILTCSLDKTIKLWNWTRTGHSYGDEADDPIDRVLRTNYPVWRARYTPFGHGILAMSQRSYTGLHLYDSRTYHLADRDADVDPVHSFSNQRAPAKEFLWRQRGGVENSHDMRDFQLVSLSADQTVRLCTPSPDSLAKVGFHKGGSFDSQLRFTRKNAVYRTFAIQHPNAARRSHLSGSDLFHRTYLHFPVLSSEHINRGQLSVQNAEEAEELDKTVDAADGTHQTLDAAQIQGAEASHLASAIATSLDSSDGERHGGKSSQPLPRTEGINSIPMPRASNSFQRSENLAPGTWHDVRRQSDSGTISIDESFGSQGRRSEAILEDNEDDIELSDLFDDGEEEEDDDDEDDAVIGAFIRPAPPPRLRSSDSVKVREGFQLPPPRTCSARWCSDGKLVCLFPAKQGNASVVAPQGPDFRGVAGWLSLAIRQHASSSSDGSPTSSLSSFYESSNTVDVNNLQDSSMFFEASSILQRDRSIHAQVRGHQDFADSTFVHGRVSAIGRNDLIEGAPATLGTSMSFGTQNYPPGTVAPRYMSVAPGPADKGATPAPRMRRTNKPSSFVTIQNLASLLPSKKYLAQEYSLTGDLAAVCDHNAAVCQRYNLLEHARVWQDAATLLRPVVPMCSSSPAECSSTVVRTDFNTIGRDRHDTFKDASGPLKRLPIRWCNSHPLGSRKFDKMLHHFETLRDEQMLAMLAFVFREDAEHQDPLDESSQPAVKPVAFEVRTHDEGVATRDEPAEYPDIDLASSAVKAVAVSWKNEHRFHRDAGHSCRQARNSNNTLMKLCAWRERYAELLYSWGLYEARAQMLKANGKYAVGGAELETSLDAAEGCSVVAECGICFARIQGDAKFCSTSAHTMHERCFELYETHEGISASNECPFGCFGPG